MPQAVKYRIVVGPVQGIGGKIEAYTLQGWQLWGPPFHTGNAIVGPGELRSTAEIGQAIVFPYKNGSGAPPVPPEPKPVEVQKE
jgi:hypothetical protein